MKKLFFFLFLSQVAFGQSSLDSLRWFLRPQNQEILISIDNLHDETIFASPNMNWGYEAIEQVEFKKDVLIAVIDGGVQADHPELSDFIAHNQSECYNGTITPPMSEGDKDGNGLKGDCAGWNFVDDNNRPEDLDGHGTHVTGVMHSILAHVKNRVKVLPLRVFAPNEGTRSVQASASLSTRLVKAFQYARERKVDIIHLSVGWPKSFMTYELEQVMKKVISEGIIVVSAAGNSSQRATIWPCQMEGVICVGALRPNGDVARFSNWGSQVDVMGPGEKILSTIPMSLAPLHIGRKGYDYKNGTSQAAPFVTAAMAVLRGVFPDESHEVLYSRLMLSANPGDHRGGLRGLFHLDRALKLDTTSFILPILKGLHSITVNRSGEFSIEVPIKNFWAQSELTSFSFHCDGADLMDGEKILPPLNNGESVRFHFDGIARDGIDELGCELKLQDRVIPFKLKILKPLPTPKLSMKVEQEELLVVNTRMGAKSRFMTLDTLKGQNAWPLYYIAGGKDFVLYERDKKLGAMSFSKGCQFLRGWQIDFDGDEKNELLIETMCDKTHLRYQFMNLQFQEVFPSVKFKPSLTIINYEDFDLRIQKNAPPVFRFLNTGFSSPSDSPWDPEVTNKKTHLYELRPVKEKDDWTYDVQVLENVKSWVKTLGLRYLPSYQIFHLINNRLLIQINNKTAWVDVDSQVATWAGLDDLLLLGSKKRALYGTDTFILQSFLTPYDYRGFLFNGVKLRFKQTNRFDPLFDILGTTRNTQGYQTTLRSFQGLIYLQYNESGELISKSESIVDRFDFLTAQDLISSVINLYQDGRIFQVVDGTKINTNYIDVIGPEGKKSFEIPFNCVTQQPVVIDRKISLPVFCAKTKSEFEMNFIDL